MTQQMPIDQPNDLLHGHHGEDGDRGDAIGYQDAPVPGKPRGTVTTDRILSNKSKGQTGRALICYVSDVRCGIDQDDTVPFGDLLHNVPRGRKHGTTASHSLR